MISDADHAYLNSAMDNARQGAHQGGVPAGAVLVQNSRVIGGGRNRKVQEGNPEAHAILDCFQMCGPLESYDDTSLYTTSSPCMMCAGAIVDLGIPRVVIGDSFNFRGAIDYLLQNSIEIVEMNTPDCVHMLEVFIRQRPGIWDHPLPPHLEG